MTPYGTVDPASGLYFTDHGAPSRPAVVLAHSILTDGGIWARQCAWLSADYRIINIDLPGHGHAPSVPGGVSLAGMADGIARLAEARGLERFHFLGVSLGAMIGFDLAARHPERLSSLVACDAPPCSPDNYAALWEGRISRARRDGMAALVDETLARWFTPRTLARQPDYLDAIREGIARTSIEGFEHCALAISSFDYRAALRRCEVRTTLAAGEADTAIAAAMRELAAEMPASAWAGIPDAGHLPHLENPDAFDAMLARHLRA